MKVMSIKIGFVKDKKKMFMKIYVESRVGDPGGVDTDPAVKKKNPDLVPIV